MKMQNKSYTASRQGDPTKLAQIKMILLGTPAPVGMIEAEYQ